MPMQRLDAVFQAALEIPADARAAWLDAACAGDVELRSAVERLLRADARTVGLLDFPTGYRAPPLPDGATPPTRFGVWEVLAPLGAGGMGEVWLAQRNDAGFAQRAAIKQVAWPTPALLKRFEHERRILARLQHPGIARLIDGGMDPACGPYLAMEYIEGQRIDDYVRARALDVRASVRLLLQVCEAVQYAHRNLVVHSDLKPSNVLVDQEGVARLLDFGIARALSDDDTGPTNTAPRLMTPDYAAPEMLRDGTVTTAVDVYALGVLSFQLLTGIKPCRADPRVTSTDAVDAAPLPVASAVLSRADPDWRARRRAIRGDLDRIVQKAMAADPARRYVSVEAFAADLRRWLDGRAVHARGDGIGYRMRKFVARNRVAAGIAALSLAVLVAIAAISYAQAIKARREAMRAEAVRAFLVDIFSRADPTVAAGKPLTAQQLVAQSQRRLDAMQDVPLDVRADLMVMLGKFYWSIADYADTEAMLRAALALAAQGGVTNVVQARARVALAIMQTDRGENDQAWNESSLALDLVADTPASAVAADARRVRIRLLQWHDGAQAAQARLAAQIVEDDAQFGSHSVQAIQSRLFHASALRALARYHEAEADLRDAAALAKSHFDYGKQSLYALTMNELGGVRTVCGDYAGAEQAFQESRRMVTTLWGAGNVRGAIVDSQLHALDIARGDAQRILATLLHDVDAAKAMQHARPDLVRAALERLGDAYLAVGRFQDAEAAYRGGSAPSQGVGNPASATSTHGLALALQWQGHYAEAESVFRHVLEQPGRAQDPPSRALASTRAVYADFLRLLGRHDEALREARKAAAQVAQGDDDPIRAQVLASLALAQLASGNLVEAQAAADNAVAIARRVLPANNWQLAPALYALAWTDLASGKPAAARILVDEAIAVVSPSLPSSDPRISEYRSLLARIPAATSR